MSKTFRLILGDQLNHKHSWFNSVNDSIVYVIIELEQETNYVKHHIQKVVGFFAAMRCFGDELKAKGHQVNYITLNESKKIGSLEAIIEHLIDTLKIEEFNYQLPDELRLDNQLKDICKKINIPSAIFDTEHFYTERDELSIQFKDKKSYLMETFYRKLRKRFDILMDGDKPISGKWNYDKENRKKLPKDHTPFPPKVFKNDVSDIIKELEENEVDTFGEIEAKHLIWPINRKQSLALLKHFVNNCLPLFGQFQDAMDVNNWSIYHARLSFSINTKMLSPSEVVVAAIKKWKENEDEIGLAQIEGFVRQILGWREYMRGVYWAEMPKFKTLNYFKHKNKLPDWYWTGDTKMQCLSKSIKQSLQYAYAHHIQRLMITGSFALLAGCHPNEVDDWYLGIYIDAIEWVEITNTRGMSQFADGGIVGTKPYCSSANYINKMSNYCSSCYYNPKERTGEKACPFNSLYWNFHYQQKDLLSKNPRIGMVYRNLDKMDKKVLTAILKQAKHYLKNINDI